MINKLIKFLGFIFLIIYLMFNLEFNSFANNLNEIISYVNISNSINQVKTTILPNNSIIQENGNLKIINNNKKNININNLSEEISFSIGEKRTINQDEYKWLCQIIQAEAGNQNLIGKILVGNVIFNRADNYHTSIKNIIFSSGQFQPVSNGFIYTAVPSKETIEAVNYILTGIDYSQGALFFMNRTYSNPKNIKWFDNHLDFLFKYQQHEFYK